MKDTYDDIINLPNYALRKKPRMPQEDRAAQFAPFAALVGYDSVINETARLTSEKLTLDEDAKVSLDMKLNMLSEVIKSNPEISITHFVPDEHKGGGAYVTTVGNLKRIDTLKHALLLTDGTKILIDDIVEIESEQLFGLA